MTHRIAWFVVVLFALGTSARAEKITVATYNIENFNLRFEGARLERAAATRPVDENGKAAIDALKKANDKENWLTAEVIKSINPDVLVLQEAANEDNLKFFNRKWLNSLYEVVVLPTNTTRDQHLAVFVKKGFAVVDRRTDYHKEPDPAGNQRGERLFARGPGFLLIKTPDGNHVWIGTHHGKSKRDNDVQVTAWRNREAVRAHQIIKELEKASPLTKDVILLGDFNDELGIQEFEAAGGGDTIANIVGPKEADLTLITQKLSADGKISFGGYWRDRYRSFIDHAVVTASLAPKVTNVDVVTTGLAPAASDHYPVVVKLDLSKR